MVGLPSLSTSGRRTATLLVALLVLGVPAAVLSLRARPAGAGSTTAVKLPFCSLSGKVRGLIAAGFQAGRSPDVVGVTSGLQVLGSTTGQGLPVPWISTSGPSQAEVPIVFSGKGFRSGARLPTGTGLDDVAPTLANAIGVAQTKAQRSGRSLPILAGGGPPRLVMEVVWKGVGTLDLRRDQGSWPYLRSLLLRGAGTLRGTTGSLPVEPTASLTTLGTGALPSEHGIVGDLLRSAYTNNVQRAWRSVTVMDMPTLADDLARQDARSRLALVEADRADQGAIGHSYFVDSQKREELVVPGAEPSSDASLKSAERLLRSGFGRDDATDLLVVVMRDGVARLDAATKELVRAATRESGGSVAVVVTGTGSTQPAASGGESATRVLSLVKAGLGSASRGIVAAGPGGIFLRQGVSAGDLAALLRGLRSPGGRPLMADAFPAFAVSLARFC